VYIGSTFNKPSKRWSEHKQAYNKWIKDQTKTCFSIYPYFRDIGVDNFKLIKIKDYQVYRADRLDRKHLLVYEQLWINKTKCVNKYAAFGLWHTLFEKERHKIYRENHKDQIKEYMKKWREDNKDDIKEKKKIYYEDNKERSKEQSKKRYEKNKEQINEKRKKHEKIYREKNKEQIKLYHEIYRRDNKEQINEKRKKHNQDNKVICPICLKEFGKYYLDTHTANKHS